jgi:hypothetical protein
MKRHMRWLWNPWVCLALAGLIAIVDAGAGPKSFGYTTQPWVPALWSEYCAPSEWGPMGMIIEDAGAVRLAGSVAEDGKPMWVKLREGGMSKLADVTQSLRTELWGPFSGCFEREQVVVNVWPIPGVDRAQLPDMASVRRDFAPVVEGCQMNGDWHAIAEMLRQPEDRWSCKINAYACVHDMIMTWLLVCGLAGGGVQMEKWMRG